MYKYIILSICIFLYTCGPKSPSPTDRTNIPTTNDLYWYGSGEVRISEYDDYQGTARSRAQAKIAEQLEVQINSSIVDMQEAYGVGLSAKVNEYNKVTIKSRVSKTINNIEYAKEWKKKGIYTVVARLNKQQYWENIRKEVDQAKTIAMDMVSNSGSKVSMESLSNYAKAIEAINPYIDQYPKSIYDGNEEQVYPLLVRLLRDHNDRIDITVQPDKPVIRALLDENVKLSISTIDNKTKQSISNIPIVVTWGKESLDAKVITNTKGKATYVLDRHWAATKNQVLTLQVDYKDIMKPDIEAMLDISPRKKEINVNVVGPKIYISSNIKNLDTKITDSALPSAVKKHFIDFYSSEFVSKRSQADIELKLKVKTFEKTKRMSSDYPHIIYCDGVLELIDLANGDQILSNNITSKDGDFSSKEVAGIRAIERLAKEFGDRDLLGNSND